MRKIALSLPLYILSVFFLAGIVQAKEPIDIIKANLQKRTEQLKKAVPSMSVQEFKKQLDAGKDYAEIIDVRGPDEFAAGHISGAVNIPRGRAEWVVPETVADPGQKIIVYCRSGSRAAYVVKMLLDVGYKDVTNVQGGFKGWINAGYPFENMHGENIMVKGGMAKRMQTECF
ncbi:rhodanese-like domain-containing protein [Maridesulfovibrio sp.]|uniref:rhodanese-like domain-containing protein n=1 Tax=unclassified Maridesulfovibrio TaxID=2794999 RepID=UPI003B00C808